MGKIVNQFITALVIICAVFFCTSGMAGCEAADRYAREPAGTTPTFSGTTAEGAQPTIPATVPAQPQPIRLTAAPEGYFDDALFIGDSRTVGLYEYGGIPGAAYFATVGMSVYSIFYDEVGGTSFQDLLESRTFGKIYVMLGINELGYPFEKTVSKYAELITWIVQRQPDAIIYIEANLHVSKDRSDSDSIYNNRNLDAFNARISEFADGERIFYLDVNPVFDDENGNLADSYTMDGTHILGKHYKTWAQWLAQNAAVRRA